MIEIINSLIDSNNIPFLTAFLIGILTSISPCPLATNITAIAFISKEIKTTKNTLLNGLFYTLGRAITYFSLSLIIYFGVSSFNVSKIFQGWGDKALGPIMILIGLVMFDVIKINIKDKNNKLEKIKIWLSSKGYIGSLFLGILFALAFCPYSGVMFFGILIPLILKNSLGLLLSPIFAIGTGLPVILFSFIIAFSIQKLDRIFNIVGKVEKVLRYIVASIFILVGIYYLQYLIKFLINLL